MVLAWYGGGVSTRASERDTSPARQVERTAARALRLTALISVMASFSCSLEPRISHDGWSEFRGVWGGLVSVRQLQTEGDSGLDLEC